MATNSARHCGLPRETAQPAGPGLPNAQQPDPVKALFGKAIDRRVVDIGERNPSAGFARQALEPDAAIDL
jgi:hypothetical protein